MEFLNQTANTTAKQQFLRTNLDPFLHWHPLKDQLITFNIRGNYVNSTIKTGTDGQFDQFMNFSDPTFNAPGVVNYTAVDPIDGQAMQGNATILPPTGYSVVADIDDVIRITKVWEPLTGLRNTFVEPYQPVPEMPQLFNLLNKLPNVGFHYATTTPMPIAATYVRWIYTTYPFGSLDMRPINVADPSGALNARTDQLNRLRETFPRRKFIMIGDVASGTLLRAYPNFAKQYPNNTACIFIRNTTYSYPNFSNPTVNLERDFQGVPRSRWFVFNEPSDLFDIDFTSDNCHPPGIPRNQTTMSGGYEGTGTDAPKSSSSMVIMGLWQLLVVLLLVVAH
jgi:phosphatidate phosphatase APP1